jgi:hypothetical protein
MKGASLLLLLLSLVTGVESAPPGQGIDQPQLAGEAARFAQAWVEGDTRVLEQAMNAEGIRLKLPDEEHLSILPRQAQAALGSFLGRHMKGEAQVARVALAEGDSGKGFAEVRWATGTQGVSEPMVFTIFFGFELQDLEWRITEIRVLI